MEQDEFKQWQEYMTKRGYLSAQHGSLDAVKLAFEAGMDAGYYEGAKFAAEMEGCTWNPVGRPFWYASED